MYIGSSLIMWRSVKQNTVALSSTEAEYMSLADCSREVLWLKQLMQELGVRSQSIEVRVDNNGTIKLAEQHVTLPRSKHIDIRHHFVREQVEGARYTCVTFLQATTLRTF